MLVRNFHVGKCQPYLRYAINYHQNTVSLFFESLLKRSEGGEIKKSWIIQLRKHSMQKKQRVLTNHEVYFFAQKDISVLYVSIIMHTGGGGSREGLVSIWCTSNREWSAQYKIRPVIVLEFCCAQTVRAIGKAQVRWVALKGNECGFGSD